ncbi:MAG: 5'-nucleotidase C-terminal domain-containing protein [Nitrospirae bacterium]|nr:5'-nucleotidase C-terminal domain-containing protein [Nitrospirota bacterium]
MNLNRVGLNTTQPLVRLIIIAAVLFGFLTYGNAGDIYTLSIAHINDTHGHLEPSSVPVTYNSHSFTVRAGGFPWLNAAVGAIRASHPNFLFLHAGDVFTGTVYFSKYHGLADVDFLNSILLDAMTPGNHEFDRGPAVFAEFIKKASFPVISANIELSTRSPLHGLIKPYTIIEKNGRKIGIIGLTTTETPSISKPGKSVKFNDIIKSAKVSVTALNRQGVNIIIILSHVGYENDLILARSVPGVDVIVGGHSHTLLGDDTLSQTGLRPVGPYPTEVHGTDNSTVLVVTAWEFGKLLGLIDIDFDADGRIVSYRGGQMVILPDEPANTPEKAEFYEAVANGKVVSNPRFQIVKADPAAALKLDNYTAPIKEFMNETVSYAEEPLTRANNQGPGPIITDSMLSKTAASGAVIAVMNSGGVRTDLPKGNLSIAGAYSLMPFNNTIYVLKLKGYQIKDAIESTIEFQINKMKKPPFIYASGLSLTMDMSKPKGRRVEGMKIKTRGTETSMPVKMDSYYKIAVSEYLAKGGDGFMASQGTEAVSPLKAASFAVDTGFIDSEVFIEYIKSLKRLKNTVEQRIHMVE